MPLEAVLHYVPYVALAGVLVAVIVGLGIAARPVETDDDGDLGLWGDLRNWDGD